MKIKENNKLIAEFMEWTFHPEERDTGLEYIENTWSPPNSEKIYVPREWGFHKSWDWLMPVVEKIESLGFYFKIAKNTSSVNRDNKGNFDSKTIASEFMKSKIDNTYLTVVEFIKWYNQNKKIIS